MENGGHKIEPPDLFFFSCIRPRVMPVRSERFFRRFYERFTRAEKDPFKAEAEDRR